MEQEGRGHNSHRIVKNIKKYVERISGNHDIYNLQRSAVLGTVHIFRKVMSIKPDLFLVH